MGKVKKQYRMTVVERVKALATLYYCLFMIIPAVFYDALKQKAAMEERERLRAELAHESMPAGGAA